MTSGSRSVFAFVVLALVSACATGDIRGLRAACGDSAECAEGLVCVGGACLVPSCAVDEFFDAAARACTPCTAGTVSTGGDVAACTAIACDLDQFWDKARRACLPCDPGTKSEGGATTVWSDYPAKKSAPLPDWLRELVS
jgi:hypothetical protein